MSRLRIFHETTSAAPIKIVEEHTLIAHELAGVGVRFERWQTTTTIQAGASQDAVIAAYCSDIERLKSEAGYQSVDVVSIDPTHPERAALRKKFLNEHTHAEDEVRFFVAGQGLFTLHIKEYVYEVLCQRGDLISVPAQTRHWFDMGEHPEFIAIRLFTNPSGWVANFTDNPIANQFPRLTL